MSFSVDADTVPVTSPLLPRGPEGSLIHQTSFTGSIASGTDSDTHTMLLVAGQKLSISIDGNATLSPQVQLLAPSGEVLSTASPSGNKAHLQLVSIPTSGVYSLLVTSAGSTEGSYVSTITLNAATDGDLGGRTQHLA